MEQHPVIVPLNYSGPLPREPKPPIPWYFVRGRLIGAIRQLTLAIGLGLIAQGLGSALGHNISIAETMGAGGFLVGVALPLRRGDRIF